MTRYSRLYEHLMANHAGDHEVRMTLREVNGIVGGLPAPAWTDPRWWDNDASQRHARKWLKAWFRAEVDLKAGVVVFRRAQEDPSEPPGEDADGRG